MLSSCCCFGCLYVSVGLGLGIALSPSVMAISGYFTDPNQHRLAVGVAATGSSLGVAIFPLLIYHLEDIYAWKGVAVLLVAVCAHLLPCGATIRPLQESSGSRPRRWKNILKIFEPVLFRSVAFNVLLLSNLFWSAGASIVIFFLPEYALSTGNNCIPIINHFQHVLFHLLYRLCEGVFINRFITSPVMTTFGLADSCDVIDS